MYKSNKIGEAQLSKVNDFFFNGRGISEVPYRSVDFTHFFNSVGVT